MVSYNGRNGLKREVRTPGVALLRDASAVKAKSNATLAHRIEFLQ